MACAICWEETPAPVRLGCGCRGDAAHAHVACVDKLASSRYDDAAFDAAFDAWTKCATCNHDYTGAMRTGIAAVLASRTLPRSMRLVADAYVATTYLLNGEVARAEGLLRTARDELVCAFGHSDPRTLFLSDNLAGCLAELGALPEAETLERDVLQARRALFGSEDEQTLNSANNYSTILLSQGKYEQARELQEELYATQMRVLGADHPLTLTTGNNLGSSMRLIGMLDDAERTLRDVLARKTRVFGAHHRETLLTADNLAGLLLLDKSETGEKAAEARAIQASLLSAEPAVFAELSPVRLARKIDEAWDAAESGDCAAAEARLREAHAMHVAALGSDHPKTHEVAQCVRLFGTRVCAAASCTERGARQRSTAPASASARTGRATRPRAAKAPRPQQDLDEKSNKKKTGPPFFFGINGVLICGDLSFFRHLTKI
jgi:hypothetical protein